MTHEELIRALRAGMQRDRGGLPHAPHDLVFTFVSPRAAGLGIRPMVLDRREDGTYVLGVTRKTAQRWIAKLDRAP